MKRTFAALALVGGATILLYGWNVGRNPVYLYVDEVVFALQAHSIAATGRDLSGRLLPLYFQMPPIGDTIWFQPAIVYFSALFLKILPLTDWAIRLPSAVIGAIDVILMFFVAKRILRAERWAFTAAILLALTPAHYIHSRMAMDYLYPVPFVMSWLLCLLIYLDGNDRRMLFLATSMLGIGFFSYIASVIMMPVYLVLTMLMLAAVPARDTRTYLTAAAGFIWPMLILLFWLSGHSSVVLETLAKYHVGAGSFSARTPLAAATSLADILQDARRPVHFSDITGRLSLYWYFFDPSFLFLTGGYAHMVNSTRRVGVFLAPLLVLVPVGLAAMATVRRSPRTLLLLAGFLVAPLAACLVVPDPYAIDRELVLLPFAILAATFGVERMLAADRRAWRLAAMCLLALVPFHFAFFMVDYWRDYPARAAYWFQGNRRGALEAIIARESGSRAQPEIFLNSRRIPYIDAHWQLYTLMHARRDLLRRTTYFDSKNFDVRTLAPGSLLLTTLDDEPVQALARAGQIHSVATLSEPGNPPLFALFER